MLYQYICFVKSFDKKAGIVNLEVSSQFYFKVTSFFMYHYDLKYRQGSVDLSAKIG